MATDPMYSMEVDQQQAQSKGLTSQHQGQTHYVCSPGCKRQFDQNPQQFMGHQAGQHGSIAVHPRNAASRDGVALEREPR